MSSTLINHQTEALDRVAMQYKESTKFLSTLSALAARIQNLEECLISIKEISDIDQAEGVQLDVIGAIVGVGRVLPADPLILPAESVLDDVTYRSVIRAKIVKNHSHGNGEDVLRGLAYLFNVDYNVVHDNHDMSFNIGVGRILTTLEQVVLNLLDILPRPSAVLIHYTIMFDSLKYFGFEGQTNALGFGEEGFPLIGGTFAEEF